MIKGKNSTNVRAMCYKAVLPCLMAFLPFKTVSGNDPVLLTQSYIETHAEKAVEQMVQFRIPASVILAQAILESNCGMSELAIRSNNHFGIKCHITWGGDTVIKTDDTLNECFRRYRSVEDSYTDHSMFLVSRSRYAHLFNLGLKDYKAWCYGLKAAGYATFPKYADELIRIIEENRLYLLDSSEPIQSSIVFIDTPGLKTSGFKPAAFSLPEMSAALFLDENDVLIQSLDLIIENSADDEELAEN